MATVSIAAILALAGAAVNATGHSPRNPALVRAQRGGARDRRAVSTGTRCIPSFTYELSEPSYRLINCDGIRYHIYMPATSGTLGLIFDIQ